jgi:hypothetical protein
MKKNKTPLFAALLFVAIPVVLASSVWPADSGTVIADEGEELNDGYEASGAAYHAGFDWVLTVHDGGIVSAVEADADSDRDSENWDLGSTELDDDYWVSDFEGIAVSDHESSLAYVLSENPDAIFEIDFGDGELDSDTWELTGNYWDLTDYIKTSSDNYGAEGLTFIDGYAVVGVQDGAEIYVFKLQSDGDVELIRSMDSYSSYINDISGLHYSPENEILYVLHDSYDRIVEMTRYGYILERYQSVGGDEEGIVLVGECPETIEEWRDSDKEDIEGTLYISDDVDGDVTAYEEYPMSCPHYSGDIDSYEYLDEYGVIRIIYENGSVQEIELEDEVNEWDKDGLYRIWIGKKNSSRLIIKQNEWTYVYKNGKLISVRYDFPQEDNSW